MRHYIMATIESYLQKEDIVPEIVQCYLREASEETVGCPMDILDDFLDGSELKWAKTVIYNKAYSKILSELNISLKYSHLSENDRRTIFTIEHCSKSLNHLVEELHFYGSLKDYTGMNHLLSIRKLECQVFWNGVEIFNK